jgi:ketosteroid isomerase-like protein
MTHSLSFNRIRTRIFASAMLVGAALLASDAMASEGAIRNKMIVTQAFDRWAQGGTTFFTDLLAADVVWTIEGSGPNAGIHRGRDQLMERAVRPLASRLSKPLRPLKVRVWADGDDVIVNWEGEGQASDGKPYTNRYVWIMRMQDGKATDVTAFLDLASFDEVLQRVPAASR